MKIDFYNYAVNELGLVSAYTEEELAKVEDDAIRREGKSRFWTERILNAINKGMGYKNTIHHNPQLSKYDIDYEGEVFSRKVEGKVRECGSKTYPDLKISAPKCDFSKCRDWMVVCYYEEDEKWFAWDLSEYEPEFVKNGYAHWKYTAKCDKRKNYWVVEDAWVFDFSKAAFEGGVGNGA